MRKLDVRKEYRAFYSPTARKVEVVDIPQFNYVMVDGKLGHGESPAASKEFQEAIGALYGVSFTLKFMSKLRPRNAIDYTVMPLEALWWSEGAKFEFSRTRPWLWRAMILQPAHITSEMVREALKQVREKRDNPALSKVRFRGFAEGLSIQIMHVGPYQDEPATIEKLKSFAKENQLRLRGKHHEIYLGDPRRTRPERLKTILRLAVSKRR